MLFPLLMPNIKKGLTSKANKRFFCASAPDFVIGMSKGEFSGISEFHSVSVSKPIITIKQSPKITIGIIICKQLSL